MALILSIETSASLCSVALHQEGKLVQLKVHDTPNAHASVLTLLITALLEKTGMHYKHIDAIAVSGGPGSYTGLRIGTSTAKGLCYALQIPLLAVNTLAIVAHHGRALLNAANNRAQDIPLISTIDARRMEVYSQTFSGNLLALGEPQIWDVNTPPLHFEPHQPFLLLGNGAAKAAQGLQNSSILQVPEAIPHARHMGTIAYQKYLRGETESVAYFEPQYLRDFYTTVARKKI